MKRISYFSNFSLLYMVCFSTIRVKRKRETDVTFILYYVYFSKEKRLVKAVVSKPKQRILCYSLSVHSKFLESSRTFSHFLLCVLDVSRVSFNAFFAFKNSRYFRFRKIGKTPDIFLLKIWACIARK